MEAQLEMMLPQEERDSRPNTRSRSLARKFLYMLLILLSLYLTSITVAPHSSSDRLCFPCIDHVAAQNEHEYFTNSKEDSTLLDPVGEEEEESQQAKKLPLDPKEDEFSNLFSRNVPTETSLEDYLNADYTHEPGYERDSIEPETQPIQPEDEASHVDSPSEAMVSKSTSSLFEDLPSGAPVPESSPRLYEGDPLLQAKLNEYEGGAHDEETSIVPDDDMDMSSNHVDRARMPFAGFKDDGNSEETLTQSVPVHTEGEEGKQRLPPYQEAGATTTTTTTTTNAGNEQIASEATQEFDGDTQSKGIEGSKRAQELRDGRKSTDESRSSRRQIRGVQPFERPPQQIIEEKRGPTVKGVEELGGTVETQLADDSYGIDRHMQKQVDGVFENRKFAGTVKHSKYMKPRMTEKSEYLKGPSRPESRTTKRSTKGTYSRMKTADGERRGTLQTSRHKSMSKWKKLVWSAVAIISALAGAAFLRKRRARAAEEDLDLDDLELDDLDDNRR